MKISYLRISEKTKAYKTFWLFTFCVVVLSGFSLAYAQSSQGQSGGNKFFETQARAVDAVTLMTPNNVTFSLWGVDKIEAAPAQLKLKARVEMESLLANKNVRCERKDQVDGVLYAQCVNGEDRDIGLFMLQGGYVTAARDDVYGTVFEDPYIKAEQQAQINERGIWKSETQTSSGSLKEGAWYLSIGLLIFFVVLGVFVFLSLAIMRGFKKVIDAQNDNMQMMARERKLREKERNIVAVMIDAEVKTNKAKIEAYIVVYEEVMRGLNDPVKPPKYKKAGDIVQKHPSLDRTVFDRNTDKLDTLGPRLSSQLIHFYARIKSNPEYVNIEPDEPLPEVKSMVSESLESAKRLDSLAEDLIDAFSAGGFSYDFDPDEKIAKPD